MAKRRQKRDEFPPAPEGWPPAPAASKEVVLHTRVVTDTGGGPDKTILLSAPFLADSNYWLAAAYLHPPEDAGYEAVKKRAASYGCPLISIPDKGPLDRTPFREMLRACRLYNVKVWHAHDYKSNAIGLMLRPFWPMKLVTTVHGWVKHTARTPLYYMVDRWSLPYYHHVITVSDDLQERCLKLGVAPQRCTLIENAIDERAFQRKYPAAQSPLRQKLGTPPGRLVIGAVGRLSAEKAFNNLIRATDNLIKHGLDVELWIAGDGDARADLEALVKHLKLEGRVRLLGFWADTIELYHALDIFVLSSLREGLPNVVLEAMAMEVPVVSTRVAGVPRLITEGETGLLCPIGDIEGLTAPMRRLAGDAALRSRLAGAGRKHIEQSYSFTQRMAKEKAIYDQLLASPPPKGERRVAAAR